MQQQKFGRRSLHEYNIHGSLDAQNQHYVYDVCAFYIISVQPWLQVVIVYSHFTIESRLNSIHTHTNYVIAMLIVHTPAKTESDSGVEPIPQPDRFTMVVASLSSAFLVISVFIFIIGFACGSLIRCKNNKPETPIPVYEDIQLSERKKNSECDLTENVAYIPSTEILN